MVRGESLWREVPVHHRCEPAGHCQVEVKLGCCLAHSHAAAVCAVHEAC